MSVEANKALINKYIAAVQKDKSHATLEKYVADQVLIEHIDMYESVLPGYWIETEEIVAEGDKVVLRGTVHGVHTGPLMDIPPSGNKVEIGLFITYQIEDGKIVDHWMIADQLTFMQQIGAIPAPAQE